MNDTKFQRSPDFIYRKIVDESILVPLHKDVADMDAIYTLNPVGAFIWDQLENPVSKEELQTALQNAYDAEPEVLDADLVRFLEEMTAIGAIIEVEQ